MEKSKKVCGYCDKNNIIFISSFVLIGLFALDVAYKGKVYQRLPESLQNRLSEWTDR